MSTDSTKNKNSRYVQGGKTTVYSNRLGWWEKRKIPSHYSDETFVVTGKYVGRPDLIAYKKYNQASLMWLVLQYNNIVDVNEELKEGSVIKLPTHERVALQILTQPVGSGAVS